MRAAYTYPVGMRALTADSSRARSAEQLGCNGPAVVVQFENLAERPLPHTRLG